MKRGIHFEDSKDTDMATTIDMMFLSICSIMVFKVHLGFAFMEGGMVRIKNQ